ncbi:sensor histidine kinase [Cohnella soli]|uniref:Sensor histidine kinase n=1 Tax=Cohnella soli TaxID=425005 RepID=A0ABW0HSR8_9BACL
MSVRDGFRALLSSWKLFLFILFSLLVLFLISFQGYVVSKPSTKKIEEQYNRIIEANMDSVSVNVSNDLNYIDDFARTLSNDPDLIEVLQRPGADMKENAEKQIRLFTENYHLRLPVNIQIYDNYENVFAYPSLNLWEEQRLKQIVSKFPWFIQRVVLDNNYLHWNVTTDFHNEQASNALYVSKNIIRNSQSIGLLVIELNGALIERLLNRVQIHPDNPILIISPDMQVLFHNEKAPASLRLDAESLRGFYQSAKSGNQDRGSADVSLSGMQYHLIHKQIAATPWTMVSLIPPGLLHADSVSIWRISSIMTVLSVIFIIVFFAVLYTKVTLPLHQLSRVIRNAGNGRTPDAYHYKGFKEIETLSRGIFQFIAEIQQQFETIKRGEGEKRKLELRRLQEQMRPHFWHNSLNSLRFLAVLHGDRTMADALLSLTKMLDYTLKNTEVLYSTLEEEKEYAMSYVRFQEIRSMQPIQVRLELDEPSLQAQVPKFTLQPIVENAIMHGFASPFVGEPRITISAAVRDGSLILETTDNGNGIEPAKLHALFHRERPRSPRSSGISLINMQQRFRLEYGKPYGIRIESRVREYTDVTVNLPYVTADRQKEGISG